MATTYLDDLVARVRVHLKEATADKWADTDIEEYVGQAVGDLSEFRPRRTVGNLYLCGGTRLVNISSLTDLKQILWVEYKYGDIGERKVPKQFKNWLDVDETYIQVVLSATPQGDSDVTGTATATVTGGLRDSSSQFSADMAYAEVENTTDDTKTWITAYTDADNVTVNDDIFASGETYTIYERVPVNVYYECKHTLSNTVKTYPTGYDDLVVLGATAYARIAYATEVADQATAGEDVTNKLLRLAQSDMSNYWAKLRRIEPGVVMKQHTENIRGYR